MNGRTAAALMALCACGPVVETKEIEATSDARELRGCVPGGSSDGIIIGNSLSTRALLNNTLLMDPASNDALTRNPLNTASFDLGHGGVFALHDALTMPESLVVMDYLVSCALDASSPPVKWSDGTAVYEFRGELGLCPKWATDLPTSDCLEAVSACLIARNNHRGTVVPISLRGDDSLHGACVSVSNRLRPWAESPSLESYRQCPADASGDRDCGWRSEGVWKCSPGDLVYIGTNSCAVGSPPGSRMLRICDGISACDSAAARGTSTTWGCSSYAFAECRSTGRISVLSAPHHTAYDVPEPVTGYGANLITEQEQFSIREGAFYGTMFGKGAVAYPIIKQGGGWTPPPWAVATAPKVIYPKMNACADGAWTEPRSRTLGYFGNGRVCVFGYCATEYVGVCQRADEADCQVDPGEPIAQTEMRKCKDRRGNAWSAPLTSYLRMPCELDDPQNPKLCARQ